jgi:iron complex transport system substrate-binding protein
MVKLVCTSFTINIVSTIPSITETLFYLGATDDVIAVSRYCDYPPEATLLPKVGGLYDSNNEAILRLRPDKVLLLDGSTDLEKFLKRNNIGYEKYKTFSLQDTLEMIINIGKLVDKKRKAEDLVLSIKEKLLILKEKYKNKDKLTMLLVINQELHLNKVEAVFAVGNDQFYTPIIESLGFSNVLEGNQAYPRINAESLLRLRPDCIIVLDEGKSEQYNWLQREGYSPRIFFITDYVMKRPGPRLLEMIDNFQKIRNTF